MDRSSKVYIKLKDAYVKVVESIKNNLRQNEQSVVMLSVLVYERNLSELSESYNTLSIKHLMFVKARSGLATKNSWLLILGGD